MTIIIRSDGNASKLVGDVMNTASQVMSGLSGAGIDLKSILENALNKE